MQDCHSSVSQNEVSERDQVARNRQQEKNETREKGKQIICLAEKEGSFIALSERCYRFDMNLCLMIAALRFKGLLSYPG